MATKLTNFIRSAAALAENINNSLKKRENFLFNHFLERVGSGLEPDHMHLATTRDAVVEEIKEAFASLDVSELLAPSKKSLGFPPVDQEFYYQTHEFVVIGKKPEVYVYVRNGRSLGTLLNDYLFRTSTSSEDFMSDSRYEISVYNVTELVANEIYRIPDGAFYLANKTEVLAEAAVYTAESENADDSSSVEQQPKVEDNSTSIVKTSVRRSSNPRKKSTKKK